MVYDLTGCALDQVTGEQIMTAMRQSADRLGCTVMNQIITLFRPHGHTCVLALAESHLTVSTWPETGQVCGPVRLPRAHPTRPSAASPAPSAGRSHRASTARSTQRTGLHHSDPGFLIPDTLAMPHHRRSVGTATLPLPFHRPLTGRCGGGHHFLTRAAVRHTARRRYSGHQAENTRLIGGAGDPLLHSVRRHLGRTG
ncbi:S-adenosylmethionine decarboxylase [Actinomadura kijaniata]|uniref:S-adenosylmethionine decarboxylase n=1 Tax=Actinomadura kijaniata TaxID=46161 RepID=UPI003F1A8F25